MNNENFLALRTRYNILARMFSALTLLSVNAYASRTFGVESYGGIQYLLWVVQTVWLFGNLGIPQTCSRFLASHTLPFSRFIFSTPSVAIFVTVWFVASCVLSLLFFPQNFGLFMLVFMMMSIQWILQNIVEGLMLNHLHFFAIIWSSLSLVSIFFLSVSSFGIGSYFAALIVSGLVYTTIVIAGLIRHQRSYLEQNEAIDTKDILRFAMTSWAAAVISAFVWERMEIYFIERSLKAADVGYFTAAISLATLSMQPIQMFSSALTPYFSKAYSAGDHHVRSTYTFLTKIFAWSAFFISGMLSMNSEFFITLIYGEKFLPASMVLSILSAIAPFGAIASVGSSVLSAHGKMSFVVGTSALLAVVSIITFAVIIPQYGLIGGSVARGILQAMGIIAGSWYIHYKVHFHFPLKEYLFSCFLSFAVFFTLDRLVIGKSLDLVVLKVGAAGAVYAVLTVLFKYFDGEDKVRIRKLFRQLNMPLMPE
jgi:O-antigen/teichoic acid export membrane protein